MENIQQQLVTKFRKTLQSSWEQHRTTYQVADSQDAFIEFLIDNEIITINCRNGLFGIISENKYEDLLDHLLEIIYGDFQAWCVRQHTRPSNTTFLNTSMI